MSSNIHLYDFNGSVRRDKLRDAVLKDMDSRDDFMKKLEDERNERHILSRKKAAALKIQSVYRSYRTRKRFYAYLRGLFDEIEHATSWEQLRIQIARLSFFFRPASDIERTIRLCSDAVSLANAEGMHLESPKCSQLVHCAVEALSNIPKQGNYVPVLRCLETFFVDENRSLISIHEYYKGIISLFANQFDLQQPLRIENRLPLRADSILRFLTLPIRRSIVPYQALGTLLMALCVSMHRAHVVCAITPFMCGLIRSGDLALNDVISAINEDEIPIKSRIIQECVPIFTHNLAMIVTASDMDSIPQTDRVSILEIFAELVEHIPPPVIEQPKQRVEDESDDDEPMQVAPVKVDCDTPESPGFLLHSVTQVLTQCALNEWFVDTALSSQNSVGTLSSLCYFLRLHSPQTFTRIFSALLAHNHFMPRLWTYILSLETTGCFGNKRSLISQLEQGEAVSQSKEHELMAPLSLFIALLSNVLQTVDDDDLANGGDFSAVVPFNIKQIAALSTHFRDLTLGLIDIAYPVSVNLFASTVSSAPPTISSKWSDMFRRVASITKVLHERDNRMHFMSNEFWWSHNRQVVMNSSMWRTGKGRRRVRERPFQFVRLLMKESGEDNNEEPPTVAELRNISILRAIPFVIAFMQRVQMFTELINRDRSQSGAESFGRNGYHIVVHRATLYEDAFESLSPHRAPDMRRAIRVQMVNWVGLDEAGIDGGGIFREFLAEVVQTALDPSRGFFATTHDQLLYPNPLAPFLYPLNFEDHFYFIGRLIAKLIYEGQLADIRFADFVLAQWLGTSGDTLLDLEYVKSYDPLVHHNLKFLKTCSAEEVDALELDFSVLIDNLGATKKIDLMHNGRETKVTAENRAEYIALYVNYFLSKRLLPMINALRAGVRAVLDPDWLRMFSSSEISILIGGIDAAIDFDDLKKFTAVHNIKSDHDRLYVDLFWVLINELSPRDKMKLLKFITGCSRPPLIGFKALTPPMGIQVVHEPDKLPSAATCMNLLKLPVYKDTDTLRSKLLFAINSAAGFELT